MAQGSSNPSLDLKKVSGTAVDTNTGNASAGTQRVVLATNQPPVAVTGTFWQTTQPVSGPLTDTQLRASAVPVSLASLPALATGTNSIGNIATVSTVTNLSQLGGTPVSMNTGVRDAGTQRVTIATDDTVPVSGTFWQATQPISGTVSINSIPPGANAIGSITNTSFAVTQATAANLNATVTGIVELGATSLAALENISITVPGTVDLGTVSLTALESITVTSSTPNNFQSKVYGAVTTTAPTYTNGFDNALSLTTSGALRVDGSSVTQPVSGTFWQTTQPVSGPLTNAELRGSAVPVSGTFWQTIQPVSGTVTINAIPAGTNSIGNIDTVSTVTNLSQLGGQAISMNTGVRDAGTQRVTIATNDSVAVTGTFYQATQPVSGPLTDTQLRASAIPVTGTFYQATQPVSLASLPALSAGTNAIGKLAANSGVTIGAVEIAASQSIAVTGTFYQATQPVSIAASVEVTGPLTDTQLRASAVPVTGTFYQATQPVSLASLPALASGSNSIGTVVLTAETTKVIGTVNVAASQTIAVTQATAANLNATVAIAANQTVQTAATPQSAATYSPSNATTTQYVSSLVAKTSAGTLYSITGFNSKTSSQFIQVHNAASLPSNGAVPVLIFIVPASSNFSLDLTPYGRYFSPGGITVCNSSTGPTLTVGSSDCWFDVQYK